MLSSKVPRTAAALPHRVEAAIVAVLMAVFATLAWCSTAQMSLTSDEVVHIPAGLALWQQRDTRINPEHPPLLKLIAAAPLAAAYAQDYSSHLFHGTQPLLEYSYSTEFWVKLPPGDVQHVVLLARAPMYLLLLATALALYLCARRLSGPWGSILSLGLFVTSPFFLGYGPLVITDMGLVLFSLASVLAFARMVERPSWGAVLWFSAALSAALLSKFSALLLPPAFVIAGFIFRRGRDAAREDAHGTPRFPLMISFAISVAVIYVVYWLACGHTWAPRLLDERMTDALVNFQAGLLARSGKLLAAWLAAHPHIAFITNPLVLYLTGALQTMTTMHRGAYLLGRSYTHGLWFYFPVLYLLKMTPAVHLAAVALLIALLAAHRRGSLQQVAGDAPALLLTILVNLVVFGGAALGAQLNIGLRHVSFPIALVIVLLSLLAPALALFAGKRAMVISVAALAGAGLFSALVSYPDYIPYYNALRGPVPKWTIAADSNADWGQQLIEVEHYRAQHQVRSPYVVTLGTYPPEFYVSGAHWFDCTYTKLQPGDWVFIGANFMSWYPDCRRLLPWESDLIAGGSVYVIRVPDQTQQTEPKR